MLRKRVTEEIQWLGFSLSHKGTMYLIESICIVANLKGGDINNLSSEIYPIIAKRHQKTTHNIKCNINTAVTNMYYTCDSGTLRKYFKFHEEAKPNIKTIIYTILNKIY